MSPRAWLAGQAPVTRFEASRLVSSDRLCHRHEATGKALAAGAVSCAHVEVLAPMLRGREPYYADNETVLLDAAKELTADEFKVVAEHWRSAADDALAPVDAAAMAERRGLYLTTTVGKMGAVAGDLDPDTTAIVLEALDLACPPDAGHGPEPPRSLAQRRHDALNDICHAFVRNHDQGGRAGVGLGVTIDHDTMLGHPPVDPRAMVCELDRFGPLPLSTACRLACDCAVFRIVMRGLSEVLDLGREQRVPNRALRRALERRDRHCRWPGCDRPHQWCDAHHLIWWQHGGHTNLENCVLLCRRHHLLVHEGGWTLTRQLDGTLTVKEPRPTTDNAHDDEDRRPRRAVVLLR